MSIIDEIEQTKTSDVTAQKLLEQDMLAICGFTEEDLTALQMRHTADGVDLKYSTALLCLSYDADQGFWKMKGESPISNFTCDCYPDSLRRAVVAFFKESTAI